MQQNTWSGQNIISFHLNVSALMIETIKFISWNWPELKLIIKCYDAHTRNDKLPKGITRRYIKPIIAYCKAILHFRQWNWIKKHQLWLGILENYTRVKHRYLNLISNTHGKIANKTC